MRRALPAQPCARGRALGRARVVRLQPLRVDDVRITEADIPAERERLQAAFGTVRAEFEHLRGELEHRLSDELRQVLDVHTLLLHDPELARGLLALVEEGHDADSALALQRQRIATVFEAMDDAYLRARMDDIDQVLMRLHAALHQRDAEIAGTTGDILVTDMLAPADLARLPQQGVLGVVVASGGPYSHSAILARSLHLPMVQAIPEAIAQINDGDVLVIDGETGGCILEPNPADLRAHRARVRAMERTEKSWQRLHDAPTLTADGEGVALWANAEQVEDIATSHRLGAQGVGLYRTEFLFLSGNGLPDEHAQFLAYRDAVLAMAGRPVTFRTLDIGADKAGRTGLALPAEPNPALGVRGVRLSLRYREVFKTQLRALMRASAYGPVRILVPMIARREELIEVRVLIERLRAELTQAHGSLAPIPLGAMIEVPAAALSLARWIGLVDFLSIGTNDLVQYLLAADRGNDALDSLHTPLHPAVVRVVADVIRTARRRGTPVSVCGEVAADPRFAPLLLALGLNELSLHPSRLLQLRATLRALDAAALRREATRLLRLEDGHALRGWLERHQPA